jgi:hypothetical protein
MGLGGRLAMRVLDVDEPLPAKVHDHLEAARRVAEKHRTTLAWEIERVAATLAPLRVPVILLKGAAYLARDLPPSVGRFASDIDILVPAAHMESVEEALLRAGWLAIQPDPYDQRYFRDWMHEIPPLRHTLRNTTLDLHHSILPPTSRLNRGLDMAALFQTAIPLNHGGLATLCPVDMILHSAAHRFSEGEHPRALRDLIDLHELLCHFEKTEPHFWVDLIARAELLGLERPLYYATRYCRVLLGTAIPAHAAHSLERHAPSWPMRVLMDAVVPQAFAGVDPTFARAASTWALYMRGHFLRMPLKLLIPHLSRKWFRRHIRSVREPGDR